MIGDILRERAAELAQRRTRAERRAEVLQQRITDLATDLDAISNGQTPPSGRTYLFAGDIAAALRGLLDEAVA